MMKWEYKVIENQGASERTNKEAIEERGKFLLDRYFTIDKLNQIGDDGWELVSYSCFLGSSAAIFKRLKNQGVKLYS